ncbi:glycine-rich domain-containing protein [Rhodovulum sp. 12E13]|uniref:glycine-rich domain-containing protein n=1 Tax=Rhodovulum sp. 12E13 TaxID=2203891 RepID=UPI0011C04C00|nr:hypothetical protein [Rhodovulum sp. 12E13]
MSIPETYLRLIRQPSGEEIPFPDNSATYVDVDLSPISEAAQLARDVNGNLVDLGDNRFRKYALTLSCSGNVQLPGVLNLWPGMQFAVELPTVLREPGTAPSREAVEGTVRTVGGYVEYRPRLSVRLTRNSLQETEFRGRSSGWSLSFEEIDAVFDDVPPLPDELVEATGGTVTDYTDDEGRKWREHDFTSSDAFVVSAAGEIEFFVNSGGGGSGLGGGGGGAGGTFRGTVRIPVGSHSVVVGGPGSGGGNASHADRHGRRGSPSSFFGISPQGGGGGVGSSTDPSTVQSDGGSGGGACHRPYDGLSGPPGTGEAYRGNPGGDVERVTGYGAAGGGGGAEAPGGLGTAPVGAPQPSGGPGGDGGGGVSFPTASGELELAGGGGAFGDPGGASSHGGGAGVSSGAGNPGQQNTGGGGGGGIPGANGGSGRVIIRYRIA